MATDSYWRLNMADKYVCIYMWLLEGKMMATGGYRWLLVAICKCH